MDKNRLNEQGFTLMELLIVMVILGLLAALVAPKFAGQAGKAELKAAKEQISLFETALDIYRLEVRKYPTTDQGLQALRFKPDDVKNWKGPYIKKIPVDPWGNEYQYKKPGNHNKDYDLFSYGADGQEGGEEAEDKDVTNW